MTIEEIFVALQEQLTLPQYPGRVFRFGFPPLYPPFDTRDNEPPGLFLDWVKGRFDVTAGYCGASNFKSGSVDFNALISLDQKNLSEAVLAERPTLLANEVLAVHSAELADTLVDRVIKINLTEQRFFCAPMVLTHSFTKDETGSLVNLLIRVSQFATSYGSL